MGLFFIQTLLHLCKSIERKNGRDAKRWSAKE